MRQRGLEIHLEVEFDLGFARHEADAFLVDAQALAGGHIKEFGDDPARGDDRFAGLADLVERPAHRVGEEGHRLLEARVPRLAGGELRAEIVGVLAAADFCLQGLAARGGVDDAFDVNRRHLAAHAGEADGQNIHYEAGVHPGAGDACAGPAAQVVVVAGEIRRLERRENQLLAG